MNDPANDPPQAERAPMNLAIVGGGRACRFFLDLLHTEPFPYLNIKVVGVCDIDPQAQGIRTARQLGIYVTDNVQDLFKLDNLDGVLELTNSEDALLELIRVRPKGVGILEHNIGRLLRRLFEVHQQLQAAEHRVVLEKMASQFLMEQTQEAIVILKPDFTIAECNEAYLKSVKRPKSEVIGAHCYEISHGLNVPCSSSQQDMGCPMIESLRTGESSHVIHEHPTAEGRTTFCDLVTYPIKNQSNEIVRVIEIWRDITEQLSRRWQEQLKALKANMKKLIQEDRMISLGKLVASCVHEINNPIQGLLTFSHLMREMISEGQTGPADLKNFEKYLDIMSRELERCGNIVSGLLSFSRESTIEYVDVELNEILEAVFSLTRHKMELQNIDLDTRLARKSLLLRGDASQLQQCFLNLIFNAIEAMPEGGRLRICSGENGAENRLFVEIRDTGCGISKNDIDHIYDPFFTTKGEGEGTGLGLSIVYGVAKNHGGSISVSSRKGEGTTFKLTFPVKRNAS